MANIISAIKNNILPGSKRFTNSSFFILKLDGDPSISGFNAEVGTIAMFENNLFLKTSTSNTGWSKIEDADSQLLNSASHLEGVIRADRSNTINGTIATGMLDSAAGINFLSLHQFEVDYSPVVGLDYIAVSSNTINHARIYTDTDIDFYPNESDAIFSCILSIEDGTLASIGYGSNDAYPRARFNYGAVLGDPILQFEYGESDDADNVIFITPNGDISFGSILDFQIIFEDGKLTARAYRLGDINGTEKGGRTLIYSESFDDNLITSGPYVALGFDARAFMAPKSVVKLFRTKYISRNL